MIAGTKCSVEFTTEKHSAVLFILMAFNKTILNLSFSMFSTECTFHDTAHEQFWLSIFNVKLKIIERYIVHYLFTQMIPN